MLTCTVAALIATLLIAAVILGCARAILKGR